MYDYDYDKDIKYFYVFVIVISISSIIYSGFLIDYYIKNNNKSKYRDYGISLIVIPVISILFLLLGYFKGKSFIVIAGFISVVNFVLIFVCLDNVSKK